MSTKRPPPLASDHIKADRCPNKRGPIWTRMSNRVSVRLPAMASASDERSPVTRPPLGPPRNWYVPETHLKAINYFEPAHGHVLLGSFTPSRFEPDGLDGLLIRSKGKRPD
ncbi:hypothetical protein NL676_005836 [Syzygium grande]|nr:hypothetical protein NL676_005836 [Syzygium grande]